MVGFSLTGMESDFKFLFDDDDECLPPELGCHAGNCLLYGHIQYNSVQPLGILNAEESKCAKLAFFL